MKLFVINLGDLIGLGFLVALLLVGVIIWLRDKLKYRKIRKNREG